jgi:hypothetical protein
MQRGLKLKPLLYNQKKKKLCKKISWLVLNILGLDKKSYPNDFMVRALNLIKNFSVYDEVHFNSLPILKPLAKECGPSPSNIENIFL